MYSAVGRRAPAHCTGLGKAILAFLPQEERRRILEEECERIRSRGFAFDLGEHEEEIRCVAAPIFDHTGYPIAALSVAIPAFRTNQDELRKIGFEVVAAACEVSSRLGCTGRPQRYKGSNGSESS